MIQIRSAKYGDLDQLCVLMEQLMEQPIDRLRAPDTLLCILDKPDYHLLVAYSEDDTAESLLGTAMCIVCSDLTASCDPFVLIENVVVDSAHRGLGVGKRLMQAAEDLATEYHATCMMLLSSAYRTDAHRFYESMGFSKDLAFGFRKMLNDPAR